MAGALFENAVHAEIYRALAHRGEIPAIYFWRTAAGNEVDFVLELDGRVFGIEAKATATPRREDVASLIAFGDLLGPLSAGGALVSLAAEPVALTDSIRAIHLRDL